MVFREILEKQFLVGRKMALVDADLAIGQDSQ